MTDNYWLIGILTFFGSMIGVVIGYFIGIAIANYGYRNERWKSPTVYGPGRSDYGRKSTKKKSLFSRIFSSKPKIEIKDVKDSRIRIKLND